MPCKFWIGVREAVKKIGAGFGGKNHATVIHSVKLIKDLMNSDGQTLQEVIADLESQFPGISERLIEDGKLRRFVNIYINDEVVRFAGSLGAPVAAGDSVTVLPAVAGG